jgi:hypothetical protein
MNHTLTTLLQSLESQIEGWREVANGIAAKMKNDENIEVLNLHLNEVSEEIVRLRTLRAALYLGVKKEEN